MTLDAKRLQANLGLAQDGLIGRATLRALFARFGANPGLAGELALSANVHFRRYGLLDSDLRLAHFMGQCAHESGGFRYMEEIASGAAYEGRKDLGNTEKGDGRRYKGRGPIQLTGRANYRSFGRLLGLDFESHPEMVVYPSVGLLVALAYWDERGLNALADRDDLVGITRKINGGTNGLEDRRRLTARAKFLLGLAQ